MLLSKIPDGYLPWERMDTGNLERADCGGAGEPMKSCETFYRYLEKKQEMSGKTGRYQYIFLSLTLGAIAAVVAFVIAAGTILSWIMAFFLNRGKEDGSLIDYMMNLLGDVIFFGTPVKSPDV